ncbi:MAG: SAM-dependent methyltransferase [Pseudobacteriovorax sp.]|nr:SAM-dependent methyltransferase [Pseudobacteriovorax sp.]
MKLRPIGFVECERQDLSDDYWGDVISRIILDDQIFPSDATLNLEQFSHLEIIYYLHEVDDDAIETGARYPRGDSSLPLVGIFGQRAKGRFNKLGLSRCELVAVNDYEITVKGLDAISESPVLDIKPLMSGFLPQGPIKEPSWTETIMANYYKTKG